MIFQIIVSIIAIIFFLKTIVQLFQGKITRIQFFFWSVVWCSLTLASYLFAEFGKYATYIGIARPVDVLIYTSIIFFFIVAYKMQMKFEQLSGQITQLVREQALQHAHKSNNSANQQSHQQSHQQLHQQSNKQMSEHNSRKKRE